MYLAKRNKIIIITTLVLVLFGIIILLLLINKKNNTTATVNSNKNLIEVSNLPQENWWRVIKIQKENLNYKTAINEYDGYKITIPSDWVVQERASKTGGMKIFFENQGFDSASADQSQGLMLNIITYTNPQNLSLVDWPKRSYDAVQYINSKFEKTQIGDYVALKTLSFLTYKDSNSKGEIIDIVVNNSLKIRYLVKGKNKIYKISCVSFSNAHLLMPACEKQIQTFKILD